MRKIIIDKEIFIAFPSFTRGLIIVNDLENAPSNKRIKKPLNSEIGNRMKQENTEHEFVKTWDNVHKMFGSNPKEFPPSIKSLLKRVQKGGGFPFINSVVALFNFISIKHLLPCGGDDIDRIRGNLHLGFAKGNEVFIPLGSEEKECPSPGEIIYFDDQTKNIMCRKWNWRNGDFTKITKNTKKIVINIDGIDPVPTSVIEQARDELAQLLTRHCKAKLTTELLNKDKQSINLDI